MKSDRKLRIGWPIVIAIGCLVAAITPHIGQAQDGTAQEVAQAGRLTWSAFECSVLAADRKDEAEAGRLFELGMAAGRTFLTAARQNTITAEEIRSQAPMGIVLRMFGPSDDFVLGRVWEAVVEHVYERVYKDVPLADEDRELAAADAFTQRNCRFLK